MFINSDTKYPYCELPEMPELHTITEILEKGVWSLLRSVIPIVYIRTTVDQ